MEIRDGTTYPKTVPVILEERIDKIVCFEFEKLGLQDFEFFDCRKK